MDTVAEKTEEAREEHPPTGKRYRLVAKSAEEAVRVLREKLGERARVLSVRQVGGQGLSKFITSPKLEVIAHVPPEEVEEETPEGIEEVDETEETSIPVPELSPAPDPTAIAEDVGDPDEKGVGRLLSRAGFDSGLLSNLRTWSRWEEISKKPPADALNEISLGLSDRFRALDSVATTDRIALVGPPGSGKTTTLCKFIAHEVFLNKRSPLVLKLENGMPNPDDALRIFCEVVGVTLFRDSADLPAIAEESPLYLDSPGLSLAHEDDWRKVGETLDELGVETRSLVVNAAYDQKVIKRIIRLGSLLGATHLVMTHFDELTDCAKLWPAVLGGGLSPLCVCHGQNVTGDFSTNVLNQLIARTFPAQLTERGMGPHPTT